MATSPTPDEGEMLLERLRVVQRRLDGQAAGDRHAAIAQELAEGLKALPAGRRATVLERALEALQPVPERSTVAQPSAPQELKREVETLTAECIAAQASRDALLRDNARLRGELESREVPSGGSGLDAVRSGLAAVIEGKKVDARALGIAPQDERMFRMTVELVRFVVELEVGRMAFLRHAAVGSAAVMRTKDGTELQQSIRKRLLSILSDTTGSIAALQATLREQREFVIGVPAAFQTALPVGVEALLAELDPEPILDRSKRILTDYAKAWEEFVRTRSDLTNLTPEDIWERFFKEPFQLDLAQRIRPR